MVTRRKSAAKPDPEVEVEEIEEPAPKPARARRAPAKKAPVVEEEIEEDDEEEAPKPAARRGRKPAAKKAPEPEPEDEDDDEEYEGDAEVVAPTKRGRGRPKKDDAAPKAAAKPKSDSLGTPWLIEFITDKTGKEYSQFEMRTLLRKMAKDGEFEREVGSDRSRYVFTGVKDPIALAVLKHVKNGEIEAAKKESLEKLKARAPKKVSKKAAAAEVEDDDDDYELEDEDDVEELDD